MIENRAVAMSAVECQQPTGLSAEAIDRCMPLGFYDYSPASRGPVHLRNEPRGGS